MESDNVVNTDTKYRIELSKNEYDEVIKLLEESNLDEQILLKIKAFKEIKYSNKKKKAMEKASVEKTKIAKNKIENAINMLRLENKVMTHYNISKMSGVSFSTVKKYVNEKMLSRLNTII